MADIRVLDMPSTVSLDGTETAYVIQAGVDKKSTIAQMVSFFGGSFLGLSAQAADSAKVATVTPSANFITMINATYATMVSNLATALGNWFAATYLSGGKLIGSIMPSGLAIGYASASTSATVACATAIPIDATVPQISEGNQVLTVAYRLINAGSKLLIVASFSGTGNANVGVAGALFVDSNANAIAAECGSFINGGSNMLVRTEYSPGDTSSHTYSLRAGQGSGTFTVNSLLGAAALLTVTEITP
jgi:hypothetical protein